MLDVTRSQQMTDIIHRTIPYSGIEREIIGTPIYNRLHRILQSSLVFMTYPSNKVKRFEHSVGTMHLASKLFFYSICNSSKNKDLIIESINKEICTWAKETNLRDLKGVDESTFAKYVSSENDCSIKLPVPENRLYNALTPKNLSENQILAYLVGLQSIRLTGLLHDIGHLPYSHILEGALKGLFTEVTNLPSKNENQKTFLLATNQYFSLKSNLNFKAVHEDIGQKLTDKIFEQITNLFTQENGSGPTNLFVQLVFYFTRKILSSKGTECNIFSDLHRIVDGSIDSDRLDYCCRDAYCSGYNESIFNYERFLSTYSIAYIADTEIPDDPNRFHFCPASKSLREIHDFFQRRWRIYADINFHHRTHKYEQLLEKVLISIARDELASSDKIPDLVLQNTVPLKFYTIWQLLKLLNTHALVDSIVLQIDDSWLDTLIRQNYFNDYASLNTLSITRDRSKEDQSKVIKEAQFFELVSSRKLYHTLFKRSSDFERFDALLYDRITSLLLVKPGAFATDTYLSDFKTCVENKDAYLSYHEYLSKSGKFYFNLLADGIHGTTKGQVSLVKEVETSINNYSKEPSRSKRSRKTLASIHISHCLVASCDFSTGCNFRTSPVWVMNEKGAVKKIQHLWPTIEMQFIQERNLYPYFHLYFLPIYNESNLDFSTIAGNLIDILVNVISDILMKSDLFKQCV